MFCQPKSYLQAFSFELGYALLNVDEEFMSVVVKPWVYSIYRGIKGLKEESQHTPFPCRPVLQSGTTDTPAGDLCCSMAVSATAPR